MILNISVELVLFSFQQADVLRLDVYRCNHYPNGRNLLIVEPKKLVRFKLPSDQLSCLKTECENQVKTFSLTWWTTVDETMARASSQNTSLSWGAWVFPQHDSWSECNPREKEPDGIYITFSNNLV